MRDTNLHRNPFQAPDSEAGRDEDPDPSGVLIWVLFGFDGRLNRRQAWAGSLLSLSVAFFSMMLVAWISKAIENDGSNVIVFVGFLPIVVFYTWASVAMRIKRWHDIGYSGWAIWISVIPYIGTPIAFFMTGFAHGTIGPNDYGHPPDGWRRSRPLALFDAPEFSENGSDEECPDEP